MNVLINILIGIVTSVITGLATHFWHKISNARGRKERLHALKNATETGEVAICLRVGGVADPLPDVRDYLRKEIPEIEQLLYYQVSPEDAGDALDNPSTANRIVEDIREGLKEYGKGKFTRVHFFPVGMLAYPMLAGAIMSNWCPILVYHRTSGTYVPLYEINKDHFNHIKRDFKSIKPWSIQNIQKRN